MKYCTTTILAALCCIALAGCDNIGEDERYIALPAVEAKRTVLIEEYTGQNCVNCPEAHEEVAKLLEQYPENVIAVSIHGGPLAMSEDQFPGIGLATADGEAYYNESKVPAPPAAMVNRSSGVIYKDQWAAAVRREVALPAHLDLDIEAGMSDDGARIEVAATINAYDNIDGMLQLWLVESGIRTLQITPSGYNAQYEHSHVLRGAINGHNGEAISLKPREARSIERAIDKKADWNPANLEVVAFVYNSDGVLQAARAKVK